MMMSNSSSFVFMVSPLSLCSCLYYSRNDVPLYGQEAA